MLAYQWDNAGQLLSRTWNNETQTYTYDPSGQLLTVSKTEPTPSQQIIPVANTQPSPVLESYRYDPAGNMLAKFENGENTTMTYDHGNQLVSAITGSKTTAFKYDPAGRLASQTTDGQTQTRAYGFLDKVLVLTKPDGTRIGFDYYPDGQLAAKAPLPAAAALNATPQAGAKKQTVGSMISNLLGAKPEEEPLEANPEQVALNRNLREELVWDGLGLLYRNGVSYAVEQHVSGGVPLVATQGVGSAPVYYINDILGTTLAVVSPDRVEIAPMTAFGKPVAAKPNVPTQSSPETNSPTQQNPAAPVKGQN